MTSPPNKLDYAHPTLRREIGLFGAVMLGLGSILGTGVFVSLAHATELAGPWVLLAIVLAGLLAYCNAMSSAQLAAAYPVSGGTYEYGYRVLNPALGFTAGWMFLLAKSASAATAALALGQMIRDAEFWMSFRVQDALRNATWTEAFGADRLHILLSIDRVLTVTTIALILLCFLVVATLSGFRRTNRLNVLIVSVTLLGLLTFCGYFTRLIDPSIITASHHASPNEILAATALVFVAFTGYGRLATLGEEVERPARTIPLAILLTLSISLTLYLFVAVVVLAAFEWRSKEALGSVDEIASALMQRPYSGFVALAAVTAMLGVLLNLILGLSRVWLAMGRRGDMPRILARVNEKTSTPVPATILSGVVIALLVLVGDVRTTWSFSAFTVLIYYAITNWAALKLAPEHRRYPRFLAWIGLFACLSLAWFVDMKIWIAGTILIAIGLVWHWLRRNSRLSIAV